MFTSIFCSSFKFYRFPISSTHRLTLGGWGSLTFCNLKAVLILNQENMSFNQTLELGKHVSTLAFIRHTFPKWTDFRPHYGRIHLRSATLQREVVLCDPFKLPIFSFSILFLECSCSLSASCLLFFVPFSPTHSFSNLSHQSYLPLNLLLFYFVTCLIFSFSNPLPKCLPNSC